MRHNHSNAASFLFIFLLQKLRSVCRKRQYPHASIWHARLRAKFTESWAASSSLPFYHYDEEVTSCFSGCHNER